MPCGLSPRDGLKSRVGCSLHASFVSVNHISQFSRFKEFATSLCVSQFYLDQFSDDLGSLSLMFFIMGNGYHFPFLACSAFILVYFELPKSSYGD